MKLKLRNHNFFLVQSGHPPRYFNIPLTSLSGIVSKISILIDFPCEREAAGAAAQQYEYAQPSCPVFQYKTAMPCQKLLVGG